MVPEHVDHLASVRASQVLVLEEDQSGRVPREVEGLEDFVVVSFDVDVQELDVLDAISGHDVR